MRTYTALDLITSSMRLIGSLASGETPSGAEATDGLDVLNGMVDAWQVQRLMIFTTARITQDVNGNPFLLNGQQSYTLGTGGDLNIPRPARIDTYGIIQLNNAQQPLELGLQNLTIDQWQTIPVKNIQSALPTAVWNDGGFPLMTLSFWPIPNTGVGLALYPWVALNEFTDLTTEYSFPPGYYKCLRYNLALDLMAEYPGNYAQEVMAAVPAIAKASMAVVKSFNAPIQYLYCDPALTSPDKQIFNYYTGSSAPPGGY